MAAIVNKEECNACKACVDSCPQVAITCDGETPAEVDADECIDCNACVDECPTGAITME